MRVSLENPEARDHFTNACRNIDMAEILDEHDFPEGTVFHCIHAIEALCCSLLRKAGHEPPQHHRRIPDAALRNVKTFESPFAEAVERRLSKLTGSIKTNELRKMALYVEPEGLHVEACCPHLRPDVASTSRQMLTDVRNLRDSVSSLLK